MVEVTKLTGLFRFLSKTYKWLFGIKAIKVYLKEDDLFALYKDGKELQLTSNGKASQFVYAKRKGIIYFFRHKEEKHYKIYQLFSYKTSKHREELILDQKPARDGQDNLFELLNPRHLTLSPNESKAYFTLEKYATGSILVEVDLKTKRLQELFSAEQFEFIQSGDFKGNLFVEVSAIKDKGRDIYYEIRDLKGEVLREFSDSDEYMKYRGSLQWKST